MVELSVLIPARCEPHLQKTVDSVLSAIEADTEIVVVCDGYVPEPPINQHPRVVLLYHPEARGQRASINEAARIARGKFIMKLDAHCAVGPGFDRILIEDWRPGWTMVPRQYNLDTETWTPRHLDDERTAIRTGKLNDYMYIGFNDKGELRTQYYSGRERHQWAGRPQVDETMSLMGCCFFLSAEDFWRQGGCDENHGGTAGWGQQGVEVALKAWLSGGALMVDKRTWFAHWFRGGDGGFPYPISGHDVQRARDYSKALWLSNGWEKQVRPLEWLVRKFDPPGWEGFEFPTAELHPPTDEDARWKAQRYLFDHVHQHARDIQWRGVRVVKFPSDLILYHKVLWETKPDVVVEVGTAYGGSALYLQDTLDLIGQGGRVVTVDIQDRVRVKDPRITYLIGDSTAPATLEAVHGLCAGRTVMVTIDGDHTRPKVKWDLARYSPLVSPGCYLVVEDCYRRDRLYGPGEARDWFLTSRWGRGFVQTNLDREQSVGMCIGGWLRRRA